MDVNHDGAIDLAEFVHQGLLDACLADPAMIEVITEQLEGNPSALSRIVTKWQELDLECRGVLPLDVVAKRLMGDLTWMASRSSRITRLAPLRDDEQVSYADFCAHQLGLEFEQVDLYYYDLSNNFAKYFAPSLLQRQVDGIWHTGIIAFGKEWYFYGFIRHAPPGCSEFGIPTKQLCIGRTLRSEKAFTRFLSSIESEFQADKYDVFDHNCNHFCDKAAFFLLGRHVPNEVRIQSENFLKAPAVKLLRPVLNWWLGRQNPCHPTRTRTRKRKGGSISSSKCNSHEELRIRV